MLGYGAMAAGGVALAPLLAACGSSTSSAASSASKGASGPAASLSLLLDHSAVEVTRFEHVIKQFEAKYPNIHVNVANIATAATFYTKINTDGVAHTLPDVWYVRTLDPQYDGRKGWLTPLDSYMKKYGIASSDFWPALQSQITYKGNVVTLPWNLSDMVVFVNKTIFKEAGVPLPTGSWDWPEFEATAARIPVKKEGHGRQNRYGCVVTLYDWTTRGFLAGNGGELISKDFRTCVADSPQVIAFFQYVVDLVNKGLSPSVSAFPATFDPFAGGLAAMSVNGSWNIAQYATDIAGKFEWGIAPLPFGTTGKRGVSVAGGGFGVSAFSNHKEEAFLLADWLTNQNSEDYVVSKFLDSLPARMSAMPEYLSAGKSLRDGPSFGVSSIYDETKVALPIAYPPYETPFATIFSNRIATPIGNGGSVDVKNQVQLFTSDVDGLIKTYYG